MIVQHVRIRNFRNHGDTEVELGGGINALLGENGEGKTNILEAISYLTLTKSFFSATDAVVLQRGKSFFELEGSIVSDADLVNTIRVKYVHSPREKQFTVNNVPPENLGSIVGRFPIVILSPEHNAITFDGPAERRKFLDILLSQISRTYLEELVEYRRILKQRNRLLLDAKLQRSTDMALLEPWTMSLVQYGSRIIHRRQELAATFEPYVKSAYRDLVSKSEEPALQYLSLDGVGEAKETEVIASLLEDALARTATEERRRGITLVGPHRDDLQFTINGASLQHYASQGQHKTYLVALKMAEFFYLSDQRNEVPIFLLDDVFSELDEHRSGNLLRLVTSLGQTIVTSTDAHGFRDTVLWNGHNRKFHVEKGTCRTD